MKIRNMLYKKFSGGWHTFVMLSSRKAEYPLRTPTESGFLLHSDYGDRLRVKQSGSHKSRSTNDRHLECLENFRGCRRGLVDALLLRVKAFTGSSLFCIVRLVTQVGICHLLASQGQGDDVANHET